MTQRTALLEKSSARKTGLTLGIALAVCAIFGAIVTSGAREAKGADELDELAPVSRQQFDTPQALEQAYQEGERLESSRKYFSAAATFFNVYTVEGRYQMVALGKLTENLIRAGLPNAASYFFIKTLQSGNRAGLRRRHEESFLLFPGQRRASQR
ncbi:MAG: hypothetical protein HYW49_12295 [Deltaproteobacteria bacterium]|nr:hypothetical protein [Deltaproteobacteria bacterium]